MSAPAKAPARALPRSEVPLDMRVARAFGLPPVATGCVIAAILVSFHVGLRWLLADVDAARNDNPGATLDSRLRGAAVLALLVGYTIAAGRILQKALFRDRQELGLEDAAIDLSRDDTPALARPLETRRGATIAGLIGAGFGLVVYALGGWVFARASTTGRLADGIYFAVVVPLLLALMARAAYGTLGVARSMAELIERNVAVDLLQPVPLRIAGRIALRGALTWIVGISISTLMFFSPDYGGAVVLVIAMTLVVAALALVIPVRGIHVRIRTAKRAELAAIEARLHAARDAALDGHGSGGQLADLLAYRDHLIRVREWPFDTSVWLRFALYSLIPLGSWFAGALVERLVNAILG